MNGHYQMKKIEIENLTIVSEVAIVKILICLRNYQQFKLTSVLPVLITYCIILCSNEFENEPFTSLLKREKDFCFTSGIVILVV